MWILGKNKCVSISSLHTIFLRSEFANSPNTIERIQNYRQQQSTVICVLISVYYTISLVRNCKLRFVRLDTNMRIWKKYTNRDIILCVLRVFVATNNTSYNFNRNNNCNLWSNYCCFFPSFLLRFFVFSPSIPLCLLIADMNESYELIQRKASIEDGIRLFFSNTLAVSDIFIVIWTAKHNIIFCFMIVSLNIRKTFLPFEMSCSCNDLHCVLIIWNYCICWYAGLLAFPCSLSEIKWHSMWWLIIIDHWSILF